MSPSLSRPSVHLSVSLSLSLSSRVPPPSTNLQDPEDPRKFFDISFLVTNFHMELMPKQNLIEFIIFFLTEIDKTINEMKLSVSTRGRLVAKTFLSSFGQTSSE